MTIPIKYWGNRRNGRRGGHAARRRGDGGRGDQGGEPDAARAPGRGARVARGARERGLRPAAQVPRRLRPGRPRRASRTLPRGRAPRVHLHGPRRHPRGTPHQRAVAGPGRRGGRPRRRHHPTVDAPGRAVPRRGQARAASPRHRPRRAPDDLLRRVRRRGAQHGHVPRPRRGPGPRAPRPAGRAPGGEVQARLECALGDLRRRRTGGLARGGGRARFLWRDLPAAQVQDRHRAPRRELRGRAGSGPGARAGDPPRGRSRLHCGSGRRPGALLRPGRHLRAPGRSPHLRHRRRDRRARRRGARHLGDRTNRRRARMKYVVADAGLAAFAEEVARRYGRALRAPRPLSLGDGDDHLGWREGPEGTWRLGVRGGAGRVGGGRDRGMRRALRAVADAYDASFIITARQDLVIAGLAEDARGPVDAILFAEGVRAAGDLGPVERGALACPALPTCGQALAEAERRLPEVVALIEGELTAQGVGRRPLQLRLTGCPNGCARPALAEVGVVGRTKSTYDVYLGGGARGDRLAALYREKGTLEDLPEVPAPGLARWRDEGGAEESFGDFYHRRAAP